MEKLRPILSQYQSRVPGSFVEEKSASLAWHYRMADAEYGARQANELCLHLTQAFANAPVEVLPGAMVVEVRPHGVSKALVVRRLVAADGAEAPLYVALGDDRTDEDMFAALPEASLSLHVGDRPTQATLEIGDVEQAHEFLRRVVTARS